MTAFNHGLWLSNKAQDAIVLPIISILLLFILSLSKDKIDAFLFVDSFQWWLLIGWLHQRCSQPHPHPMEGSHYFLSIIFSPNFNIHYLFIFFTFIVWQCSIMIGQYNLRCMLSNIPVIFFEAKFPTYVQDQIVTLSLSFCYKSNIIFCLWVAELCQEF